MYPFLYKKQAYLMSTVIKARHSGIGSFCRGGTTQAVPINKLSNARTAIVCMVCFHRHCPKNSKEGVPHRSFAWFYTIISLSSLGNGSICRVRVVWAPQGKSESAYTRINKFKKHGFDMFNMSDRAFLNFMLHSSMFRFFLSGASLPEAAKWSPCQVLDNL